MKLNRQTLGYIYNSCAGRCWYCGTALEPFGTWEVDHMTPVEKGGADAFHNLVAACRQCNRSKGCRTIEEFRQAIVRRALNHITDAQEGIEPYLAEPGTNYDKAKTLLEEAGNALACADIIFHGEAATLPRGDDPVFSDGAALDVETDDTGDLTVN